jgi:hypothetical protein
MYKEVSVGLFVPSIIQFPKWVYRLSRWWRERKKVKR